MYIQLIATKAQLEEEKQKRLSLERDLEISTELLNVSIDHFFLRGILLCYLYLHCLC